MTRFEKHLISEFLKMTGLFLVCFLTLFILIDYASHSAKFFVQGHFSSKIFFFHTIAECLKRFPALLPYALLLGTIKTISQSSQSLELLGHMASGRSLKRTLIPLVVLSLLFTLTIYANFEWGTPKAFLYQDSLGKPSNKPIQIMTLKDGSHFFFQRFLREENQFLNAFWIQNIDHIIHIKTLKVGNPSTGSLVNYFDRDEEEQMHLTTSFETAYLDIPFKKNLVERLIPSEELPLSTLYKKTRTHKSPLTEKEAIVKAAYYNKITLPWLCFLAVLAPLPFSILFKRDASPFPLYGIAFFLATVVIISLNAGFILSKRELVDPLFVTVVPLFIMVFFSSVNFLRCHGSF